MSKHNSDENDVLRMPVVEETLDVRVRQRQEGVVRFTTRVENESIEVPVELRFDELSIERVPREEATDQARQPWYDGDTLVIPVYEERPVIEKRLFLTEEIRVSRRANIEQVSVQETVRREVVDIETEQIREDS